MNEVEQILNQAERRHRKKLYFGTSVVVAILGLVGMAYLVLDFTGRVTVVVAPNEAASSAEIQIIEGYGFVNGSNVRGLKRNLTIRVTADGYQTEKLSISNATWERKKVDVIMQEILAGLQAVVIPQVADVQWYLNETFIATGEALNIKLNSGDYHVRVNHPYYQTQTEMLAVTRGKNYDLELHLQRIDGEIFVTSEPSGAEVIKDDMLMGKTPLNLEVKGGIHELNISSDGYDSQTESITVDTSSQSVHTHYELARSIESISLKLSPKGGALYLDGKAVSSQQNKVILPLGTRHNLRYSKQGFNTRSLDFIVEKNHGAVEVQLSPIYGVVTIDSQPQADIEINGTKFGQTPQQLKIHAVSQTVTLSAPGYRPHTRTFVPDEDKPLEVFAILQTVKDYRIKNAPTQYSNSAGIEMKLFKNPGSITLGAPRGEIGRRANEFVRKVTLSKPFYAGVHEVTVEQFDKFRTPNKASSANRQPVVGIDWVLAAKFCNWLSNKEGFEPVYLFSGGQFMGSVPSADGYRMLTEAEWEWLARKAGRTQQTLFPWGNSKTIPANSGNIADESAVGKVEIYVPNYRDGSATIADTGQFSKNPAGLHDLAGNVKEWIHDIYTLRPPKDGEMKNDILDRHRSPNRTIKGSSWKSWSMTELRASWRDGSESAADDVGFRIGRYLY